MQKEKQTISAVQRTQFQDLLKSLDLKSKLHCAVCNDIVTHDNVSLLFRKNGTIQAVCKKPECLIQMGEF